jgi:glycerophosphoryl diester phosphodiesterase
MTLEIIAHRGFPCQAPENTLASFQAALKQGANSVEFDLQLTADGVPIIFHDQTLERTTNGKGKVGEKTLLELSDLDTGSWFSAQFTQEKISTLAIALPVLAKFPQYLYLDVKPHCIWSDQQVEYLITLLSEYNLQKRAVITSFNDQFLQQFRKLSPDFPIGHIVANLDSYQQQLERAVFRSDQLISSEYKLLLANPGLIAETFHHGIDIVAWTVDDQEDLQALLDLGVNRIVTNTLIPYE